MPGGLCGCGAFGVLAGGMPLWLVRGWVCGHGSCAGVSWHLSLGLWAGEQRRHKDFILSLSSDNIIVPFSLFF